MRLPRKKSRLGRWGRRHRWKSGLSRWGCRHPFLLHVPFAAPAPRKPQSELQPRPRSWSRRGAPRPWLSLPRRALAPLMAPLNVPIESVKMKGSIMSTADTSDATRHEGPRAVKQCRILLLLPQTSATSLRFVCVVNVVCNSIPHPHYCEVTSSTAVTSFFSLHLSTPLCMFFSSHIHDRDPHQSPVGWYFLGSCFFWWCCLHLPSTCGLGLQTPMQISGHRGHHVRGHVRQFLLGGIHHHRNLGDSHHNLLHLISKHTS